MKQWILRFFGVGIIFVYIWTVALGHDILQPSIASKILRFHVLANSDSNADQAVKLEVRDAVGTYLQPLLSECEDLEETKRIVEAHMEEIVNISEQTLQTYGYTYCVTAKITETDFPQKTYGVYTFPKGTYEALQIVIGEGKGQNWWCVLYPNMCFKGSVFEVIEEEAEQSLREVLNVWEYADVFDSGNVELRFKFLEYFMK
ncbi:MAG: stage II sporulation protein R [Lachnospiraceae bacterium]|nr:stage II sporulation protein R [Lachnospiraceae bacterium]